ncbi:MAG: serine/threonine-protein kinase [Myxococcota bacterium]
MQRRATQGKTPASRLKTLYLHLYTEHGPAAADAFLLSTRLDRDFLSDETRLVPIELWHTALAAFASRWGRERIPSMAKAAVHPENLGVWTHVLRGAPDIASAYRRLDHFGGEHVWTERWRTLEHRPGYWRGALRAPSDAGLERDGLFALARQAELASVPLLFGAQKAQVRALTAVSVSGNQEFEVRWRESSTGRMTVLGSAGGAAVGAIWNLAMSGRADWMAGALLGAAGAGTIAVLAGHESRRRAQSIAQLMRIQALERAATLREAREHGAVGFHAGQVVAGQYRLTEKLGVGANGTIWEAERISDGGLVAIKLLRAAVAHDTIAADRLRREAAALGLAWHPNVVEIYDDGHLPDGTSYLVMERLYGESLAARLRRKGMLTPREVLPIALEMCEALGAVHAAGIVHRDVKPSNIFLSSAPGTKDTPGAAPEHAKILDFGVARVEWAETRLTNADVPLGTPGYMPPEQLDGQEVDARSDVYALGAALYECLSGRAPPARSGESWDRSSEESTGESGVQPALRAIPSEWRSIIERAMSPLPRDRFPDTRAFREALLATPEARLQSA